MQLSVRLILGVTLLAAVAIAWRQRSSVLPSTSNRPASYSAQQPPLGVLPSAGVKPVSASAFAGLIEQAAARPRRRLMTDYTRDPENNLLQNMVNTWTEGSYSPIHLHEQWAETFVCLDGALAFFIWTRAESREPKPRCHVIRPGGEVRALIVESGEWHAMTALPRAFGGPGHAVVLEMSGHSYAPGGAAKTIASFAPQGDVANGNGDRRYFEEQLLPLCRE